MIKIDVTKLSTEQRSKFVARVFQDPIIGTFAELAIEENMSIAFKRGRSRGLNLALDKNLREEFKLHLSEFGIDLENRLKDSISNLSGGKDKALSLLCQSPPRLKNFAS